MDTWARFALGMGGLLVAFAFLDDLGHGEVAAGIALLVAGSATILYLPDALAQLAIPGVELAASGRGGGGTMSATGGAS